MAGRIADPEEVLAYLTEVMRGDGKDSMKAAELLGKHYGLTAEREESAARPVLIDDVRRVSGG